MMPKITPQATAMRNEPATAQVGGVKPTTNVDQVAIDMAGTRTPVKWSHIADKATL